MIIDTSTQLSEAINNLIDSKLAVMPKSYPCKVSSVDSDGVYVEVETLLKKDKNDKPLKIPVMQSPYIKAPIKEGDIGLALNCSFLFEAILDERDIDKNIEALKNNALFFIPLVSKQNQKEEVNKLTLLSQNKKNKIILDDDKLSVSINNKVTSIDSEKIKQEGLINVEGAGGNLYKALDILIQLMDLLASGMNGNLTSPTAYNGMKQTLVSALQAIVKK